MKEIACHKRSSLILLPSSGSGATPGWSCFFSAPQRSQKVFEVPASKVRAMTPDQREQAKAYARQQGIRWRIVEGK
jgi:hypothetical protein